MDPFERRTDQPPDSGLERGYRCTRCGALVPWSVAKYCRDNRPRFGGRTYCRTCQATFPPA